MVNSASPTLEDVALTAGVSTATISRCINEPHKVAAKTRERIEESIKQLGYTPNFGGRALASKRTNTIGAVIPTMANALFANGLQAFQETLSKAGNTLLVASAGYDTANELDQIRTLIARGADGLLLIGATRPEATVDFLNLRRIPYVISWQYKRDSSRLFAGFDNSKAAEQMTLEVLRIGHKRLAVISGQTEGNDRASSRIEGVKRAITTANSEAALSVIIETDYTLAAGGDAFERLISATPPPTAIICGNDVLAAGAIVRAQQLGVRVPDDISITGFDDINLATVVRPALTTMRVPQKQMGCAAATLLLAKINGEQNLHSIEFEADLIRRESLAPPVQ
ncbi:LacI family transcriptional regulator [Chromatiales bacterium (ex Bugula neritina AB1)]|nr:LacI family transcriptional regulator [Chromatiales bacterium (ex Bugula neritina AB1)]